MTPSLIATGMFRDPLYHTECLTAPSYTKYLISSAPMRGSQRSALQCLDDDAFDLAIADFAGHPRTRLVEQPVEAALDKAPSPLPDGLRGYPFVRRHRLVAQPGGTAQHDARPQRQC